MEISKANLTAHVAAKDDSRPVLAGIHFDDVGTVSADGFRLLVVPYPNGEKPEFGPVTINAKAANTIAKMLYRNSTGGYRAEVSIAERTKDNGGDPEICINTHNRMKMTIPQINGQFPDYRKIFPEGDVQTTFALNINFLIDTLKQIKTVDNNDMGMVRFSFYKEGAPVRLDHPTNKQAPIALIMPMTINNEPRRTVKHEPWVPWSRDAYKFVPDDFECEVTCCAEDQVT